MNPSQHFVYALHETWRGCKRGLQHYLLESMWKLQEFPTMNYEESNSELPYIQTK